MAHRVVPTLRLAVLCEDVEFDGNGRPALFAFPVHTMQFPPEVREHYCPPTARLYVQLHGGVGTFFISAVLREEGDVIELYRTPPSELAFDSDAYRVIPLELVIELSGLSFPRPGMYELVILANHVNLHDSSERLPLVFPPVRVTVLPPDGIEGGSL